MPTIHLIGPSQRAYAFEALQKAPDRAVVTITAEKRTPPQNRKMWAMLQDIATAKPEGRYWTRETWKAAFMHSLGHQVLFAEGLDGSGPFPLGFRSSRLTVPQMADLITVIQEYGDRHGVQWKETKRAGWMNDERASA